jgi:uncharacterized protein (TIGR03083 family)
MDRNQVWDHTVEQRYALAGILRTLTPDQWETPSLCAGWRVRDVAAHVISSPQLTLVEVLKVLPGIWRGYDGMIGHDVLRRGRATPEEILEQFEQFAGMRRAPAVTTHVEPLLDVLVHTQDIVRPLGIEHAMPSEAAAVAADRARLLRMPGRRVRALRLVATDVDWSRGSGQVIEGPMEELLILCAGRQPRWDRLSGAGVAARV